MDVAPSEPVRRLHDDLRERRVGVHVVRDGFRRQLESVGKGQLGEELRDLRTDEVRPEQDA